MHDMLTLAAAEIRRFLDTVLPSLGSDWWKRHVVDRLTFPQQRTVEERGFQSLADLDLAALLRVLDQNWYEVTQRSPMPRDARSWVREIQTVRNKWAHAAAQPMAASETYRDLDTIGRLLAGLGTSKGLEAIEERRVATLRELTPVAAETERTAEANLTTRFSTGDLVTLRSNRETTLPIIEVLAATRRRRAEGNETIPRPVRTRCLSPRSDRTRPRHVVDATIDRSPLATAYWWAKAH